VYPNLIFSDFATARENKQNIRFRMKYKDEIRSNDIGTQHKTSSHCDFAIFPSEWEGVWFCTHFTGYFWGEFLKKK
jgi:hypothetical protein